MLRNLLVQLLRQVANNIESGNCNMTDDDFAEMFSYIESLTNNNGMMTKYEACKYLHISRATFDRMIADGKVPNGRSKQGTRSLFWTKADLDNAFSKLIEHVYS